MADMKLLLAFLFVVYVVEGNLLNCPSETPNVLKSLQCSLQDSEDFVIKPEIFRKVLKEALKKIGFTGDVMSKEAMKFFESKKPKSAELVNFTDNVHIFFQLCEKLFGLKEKVVKHLKSKGKPAGTIAEIVKSYFELHPDKG